MRELAVFTVQNADTMLTIRLRAIHSVPDAAIRM